MKIECQKDKLRWAMTAAEKITGKNLSLPALGLVFIEAKDKNLFIRSTNLDLGLEIILPARVDKSGKVLIRGSVLANLLANLPAREEKIELESANNNLIITVNHNSSLLKTCPADDFPVLPRLAGGEVLKIDGEVFIPGLRSVMYAASLSDIKPEIASVYVYAEGESLVFVATDSFRLAEKNLAGAAGFPFGVILPIKNVSELVRVFENETGPIEIRYDKNQAAFVAPGVYVASRLVDGVFPDYKQIISPQVKTTAIVAKEILFGALKLAGIFSDRLNQVTFRIAAADDFFEVGSRNDEIGEHISRLGATLSGEDLVIGLNLRYLLDVLPYLAVEKIRLDFSGKGKPVVVSGVGDETFRYLIMPLNL